MDARNHDISIRFQLIPNIPIIGAHLDTNFVAGHVLHDGRDYRMYFFGEHLGHVSTNLRGNGRAYEYGHNSIPVLAIQHSGRCGSGAAFVCSPQRQQHHLYLGAPWGPDRAFTSSSSFRAPTYSYQMTPAIPY